VPIIYSYLRTTPPKFSREQREAAEEREWNLA
jgi:hypothetical protein